MRRPALAALVLLVAVVALASPLASARGIGTATPPVSTTPALVTDAIAVPAGAVATAMPSTDPLVLEFTLGVQDPTGLDRLLEDLSDPASTEYRHFLTHAEFESRFAPAPATLAQVGTLLTSYGAVSETVAPDRLSLVAQLPAGAVETLLGVRMVQFTSAGDASIYTSEGTPTLPSPLRGLVTGIVGLSNAPDLDLSYDLASATSTAPVPIAGAQFAIENSTGQQWFVGSDFTNALRASELLPGNASSIVNATYPTGVAIATLLASGYNGTLNQNTPPWDPVVVDTYLNDTLAPAWAAEAKAAPLVGVPVSIDGVTPPSPGSFGSVNDSTLNEWENSLDLEMAGSLAPGAGLYNFYFAGSLLEEASSDADVAAYFDQDLASALSYDYGSQALGVVSASFGLSDLNDSTWDQELEEAQAMGVTVVAASGDQGNAPDDLTGRGDGQWPIWPASVAFNTSGVVAVGGVTVGMSGTPAGWFNGTDLEIGYDANTSGLNALSVWWDTSGGRGAYAGSEGGIATGYAEPYWQFHSAAQPNIVNVTIRQGASALGRAEPDVAFPANATIAFVVADAQENVYFTVLEGTSIAAPAFAGLVADEIAVAHHAFGFLDPELYRIGSYYAANPTVSDAFFDVTNGSNFVFEASPGWDGATGWGVPVGPLLYAADADPAIRDYVYSGPTPGLPASSNTTSSVPWTEIYIIFGVGIVVAIVLVAVATRSSSRSRGGPPPGAVGGPPAAAPYAGWPPPPPPDWGGPPPPPPPSGAIPPPPPAAYSMDRTPPAPGTGATFLCPYCGAPRPAEPVRCPRCGAL